MQALVLTDYKKLEIQDVQRPVIASLPRCSYASRQLPSVEAMSMAMMAQADDVAPPNHHGS